MAALLLAFASSVAWGAGDFLGGLKSRQHPVLVVLLVAQFTGLVLIAGYVAIRAEGPPGGELALWAPLSGVAGAVGLAAFYRALAVGNMGVVAPISATAAVVPLVVGVAGGDRPAGFSTRGSRWPWSEWSWRRGRRSVGASAGGRRAAPGWRCCRRSASGCSSSAWTGPATRTSRWAILVNRSTSVTVLLVAFAALRPQVALARADLGVLVAVGTLDIAANVMFAIASTKDLVSLVSVLASLYPITTVGLAAVVLGERPHRTAQVGVVLALCGVALIAGG